MSDGELPAASSDSSLSRRTFLKGVGGALGGAALGPGLVGASADAASAEDLSAGIRRYPADGTRIQLNVNGNQHEAHVLPSDTLLTVLREKLHFTGAKEACGRGACGACTVLVDGRAVNACMILALDARDAPITTVEGLADGRLHPLQQAFVDHDACQCGYCIPGFVMRSHALLAENPHPNLNEIKKGLAGNTCRCGAYVKIFEAVQAAAKRGSCNPMTS